MADAIPEILTGRGERSSYGAGRVGLGLAGNLLAAATVFAAALVVGAMLFGKLLVISAALTLTWPWIFSPEFTLWVFGTPTVPFWKVVALSSIAGFGMRWLRGRREPQ